MGLHRGLAIVLVILALASPAAAERQRLDELGMRVEPPEGLVLQEENGLWVGSTKVDSKDLVIEVRSEEVDVTELSRADLMQLAMDYIGRMSTEDIRTTDIIGKTTEVRGREVVVVTAVFGGADIYAAFYPTAERLVVVEWITPTYYPLWGLLSAFFASGIAFDGGQPGFPTSVLAEQLILAASGRGGFKKVADTKVKIIDGHGIATTISRKR